MIFGWCSSDDVWYIRSSDIFRCLELRPKTAVGGEDMDEAIWAVFSALVWHTQQLREDMDKFGEHWQIFRPTFTHTVITWWCGQVWWALANIQTHIYTHSNYLLMWTSLVSIGKYSDPCLHTQELLDDVDKFGERWQIFRPTFAHRVITWWYG